MIILKESQAFAHGNHREVYKHPDNPKRCLKLMTEHWKDSPRWQRANILGKIFRPHTYFNENESEYQFSKATKKKIGLSYMSTGYLCKPDLTTYPLKSSMTAVSKFLPSMATLILNSSHLLNGF